MKVIDMCRVVPSGAYIELVLSRESKICDYSMRLTASNMIVAKQFDGIDPNYKPYLKYAESEVLAINQKLEVIDNKTNLVYMLYVEELASTITKPKKKEIVVSANKSRELIHYKLNRKGDFNLTRTEKYIRISHRRSTDNYSTVSRIQALNSEAEKFLNDIARVYGSDSCRYDLCKEDSPELYTKWWNYLDGIYTQAATEAKERGLIDED